MDLPEPLLDCNFAEILAGDLGRSSAIFQSKNLTAGPPAPGLVDDGTQRRYSMQDRSLRQPEYGSLSRLKSLQTITQPPCSPFGQGGHQYRNSSDSTHSSSTTTTTSSGGMEPPSVATRDVSLTTAPTSGRPSPDKASEYSWMDFGVAGLDLEEFGSEDRRQSLSIVNQTLPQPPPQKEDNADDDEDDNDDDDRDSQSTSSMGSEVQETRLLPYSSFNAQHHASQSTIPTLPLPSRKPSMPFASPKAPTPIPQRRSSLNHSLVSKPLNLRISPPSPRFNPHYAGFQPAAVPTRSPSPDNDRFAWREASSTRSTERQEVEFTLPPRKEEVSTPVVGEHLVQVEEWLSSSIDMGYSQQLQSDNEHAVSRFPVPTEVLDTLRVSVSCFPETMLLCSSLSIETIRAHSRKFKYGKLHFATESQTSLALTDDSYRAGSKWKWFGSSKKPQPDQSPQSPPKRSQLQLKSSALELSTPTSPSHQPGSSDWQAIKRIFPAGTDFLCDALYAHILAYNYITTLCPRSASVPIPPRPSSKSSVSSFGSSLLGPELAPVRTINSDSTRIPRKAASLLGMQCDGGAAALIEPNTSRSNTLRSKSSFMLKRGDLPKNFTTAANRNAEEHEASLRELRLGLAKCIARLIGTLRLTSGEPTMYGCGRPPSRSTDDNNQQQHIDPYLMRSLCELVRNSEEK